mgnify:CR=1 FL=1
MAADRKVDHRRKLMLSQNYLMKTPSNGGLLSQFPPGNLSRSFPDRLQTHRPAWSALRILSLTLTIPSFGVG